MATSVVFPRVQFFANNGRPLIGGRIHTYVAGSSTRARTYKDAAKAQPNTNPIVLDARGEAAVYLAEGVEYKFVIEDSTGALIMTQDPVYGAIWPNAEIWPSDATLSYQYMMEAKAAAGAIGPIKFYDTYAQALGDIANLIEGDLVEVSRDEASGGARTRYRVQAGALVFVVNLEQLRIDLAVDSGSARVGYDGGTTQDVLDNAKPMQSYSEIGNYSGRATGIRITTPGIDGIFQRLEIGASPPVDGATVILDALGRPWKRLFSGAVDIRWFGAKQGGVDAAPAINAALANHRIVRVSGGGEYHVNSPLLMGLDAATLEIDSDTTIRHTVAMEPCINVTGSLAVIRGKGSIVSPAIFDGTQGESQVAVILVDAPASSISGIRLVNTPKFGILYKNASRHLLTGTDINCGVPKSFYNELDANTLNQGAVAYDPPPSTEAAGLQLLGNTFSNGVNGVLTGNFGPQANESGIIISGNIFRYFWDHGVYLNGTAADYSNTSTNSFYECRRPIVSGGVGSSVVGNICTGVTQDSSMEQLISIRDPVGGTYCGNILNGYGAGLDLNPLLGTTVADNLVMGNNIRATGPSSGGSGLRLREAATSRLNILRGNVVDCFPSTNFGAIFVSGGVGNVVSDNDAISRTLAHTIKIINQQGGDFSSNRIVQIANSDSATTVAMMLLTDVTGSDVTRNKFRFTEGGVNLSVRGISGSGVNTGNNVNDNTFDLSAPSLTSASPIFNIAPTTNNKLRNILNTSERMYGAMVWPTGTASFTVTNANVLEDSRISILPTSSQAGVVMRTNGVYVTAAAGSFTIFTADGANIGATSSWKYDIS